MREQDIPVLEVYGKALLDAARQQNCVDQLFEEAESLRSLLKEQKALLRFLAEPAIQKSEKHALLARAFQQQLHPLMFNLPRLMVDKNRGALWKEVLDFFIQKVEADRGIFEGKVTTAYALSEQEKTALAQALEHFTQTKLRLHYLVDPRVLGGVLFRSGDKMVDSTVRGRLHELRARLDHVKVDVAGE